MTSWFLVDFLSILPFDLILDYGEFSRVARFTRIGKIQKLIKIMKLFRLVKTVKVKNKMTRHLQELIKISVGVERVVLMLITFMILQHITACLWIFIGKYDSSSK